MLYVNRLILICSVFLFPLFCKAQIENKSLQFTGIENVRFNQIAELDTCKQVTLQMWVNIESWTENSKLFCQNTNKNNLFSIQLGKKNAGEILLYINNTLYTYTDLKLTEGKWFQLTLLKNNIDNTSCRLFVNGVESLNYNKTIRKIATNNADANLVLGTGFTGEIDEVRIWKKALNNADFYLQNTVNKYHPDYSSLVAYWKADQLSNSFLMDELQQNHSMTKKPTLIKVTDNKLFNYKLVSGYTTFSSFFSRQVERETYLMTNDLLVLSGNTNSNGDVTFGPSDDSGNVENIRFLSAFKGRKSALSFDGRKSVMKLPENTISLSPTFSFGCWIFIEKWKNGAVLIKKKGKSEDQISIELGNPKTLTVKMDGKIITSNGILKINTWQYVSVSGNYNLTKNTEEINFNILSDNNDVQTDEQIISLDKIPSVTYDAESLIGEGFCGKMTEISWWKTCRAKSFQKDALGIQLAEIGKPLTNTNLSDCIAYWKCDNANNPGFDSYSWTNFIQILRSAYKGYTGYKVRASFSGGEDKSWEGMVINEESRKRFANGIAQLLQSPLLDGVDLDFEWCYDDTCWANYAKTIHEVRKVIPAGKVFTVTPHVVAYKLPVQAISDIDFALFQNYGPSPDRFTFDDYTRSLETFRTQGYPDQKIILSTSTTTSKGISATGDIKRPTAYKNLINSGSVVSKDALSGTLDGYTYWINSVAQTRQRASYVVTNNLAGIMYWDMGCDVSPDSEFSIVRAINAEISSNLGLKKYE